MTPSITQFCQALVSVPVAPGQAASQRVCSVPLEGGLQFSGLGSALQQVPSSRQSRIIPGFVASYLAQQSPRCLCSPCGCFQGGRGDSAAPSRLGEQLLDLPAPHSQALRGDPRAENLSDSLFKHSPFLALLSLPPGKSRRFPAPPLLLLHVWEEDPPAFLFAERLLWVAQHQFCPSSWGAIPNFTRRCVKARCWQQGTSTLLLSLRQ